MAVTVPNGQGVPLSFSKPLAGRTEASDELPTLADLDVAKLVITLTDAPKPIPTPESLRFGEVKTDHMLVVEYDPSTGWSAPEIKPYAPLTLDPASSCFHYCPNVFEGMKAYLGPDGKPRLFRPGLNMERFLRSAERVALPTFHPEAVLALIKRLVRLDSRWIPRIPGYSLYIRPTIIGTRSSLGVTASDRALLFVILCPTGPYFPTGPKPISLLAVDEHVRSWPGGTGEYKLGLNYAPGFMPQKLAAAKGYQQILWLLGEEKRVTEAGAMNFFAVVKRDDEDWDVITPPLDGTILPGVTRSSALNLTSAHPSHTILTPLPHTLRLYAREQVITMSDLSRWSANGRLLECFAVGTAVVVAPVGRIGLEGQDDIILPGHKGGLGPLARALWERMVEIQEGRVEWEGWCVLCE